MLQVISKSDIKAKPAIKWVGGKTQLLPQFQDLYPRVDFDLYIEPFVGGGAVFFDLTPQQAILMDNNPELINLYTVVRDDVESLIADLKKHRNEENYFYEVRAQDSEALSLVCRASRMMFLNKTAFNGLWRVNRSQRFNVPFGRYKNPKILDEPNLRAVSETLQNVDIIYQDFEYVLNYAQPEAFVYLDPPYHPLSATANFTSYTSSPFGLNDQERLAETYKTLDQIGCYVMLSNSDTPLIRDLYKTFRITEVVAKRAINCRGDRRGAITELVIRNY